MPYFNKQRGTWAAQLVVNGVKLRSQHPTKEAAEEWERKKREVLSEQPEEPAPGHLTLAQFAQLYLEQARGRFSAKTVWEKEHAFQLLFDSISPETDVFHLHKGLVLSHFARQARSRSGNAANKDRKNLVAAWSWAAQHIPSFPGLNPFLTDRFPEKRCPRYVPPEKDFRAVLRRAETDQDKVMLLCFLHLAARRNELFRLRCDDVDLDRRQVRLCTRKRRDGSEHFDWLPMSSKLSAAMSEHLACISGPWVFPDPQTDQPYVARQQWLARLCRKAKVKEFGLHGIRHLSASILVAKKVSLLDVKGILRHKNLTTTQRYVHRLETMRNAVEVFE